MPSDHRPFQRQAAFGLEGVPGDLFDASDELDGVDLAATDELARANGLDHDGLLPLDLLPTGAGVNDRFPAARLFNLPVHHQLTGRDDARRDSESGDDTAHIIIRVGLAAAGHALLVASTIEREIRRCERAARVVSERGASPSTREFLRELAATPHPGNIKEDGLRLTEARIEEGHLTLSMVQPSRWYLSLHRWPRLTIAFATAAIADRYFHFLEGPAAPMTVQLPATRLKAVAGGIPEGAVEVRLSSPNANLRTQI